MNVERPERTGGELAGAFAKGILGTFGRLLATMFAATFVALVLGERTGVELLGGLAGFATIALMFPFWGRHMVSFAAWLGYPRRREVPARPDPVDDAELPDDAVVVGALVEDGTATEHVALLTVEQRNRHVYAIGKTRTGKTTLLKNLVVQDMEAGHGMAFIDPHGDAAVDLLGCVPEHRLNDVIYFDPASKSAPAFNPLALHYPVPKLTEDVVSVFKMFFGDSWGPRLEHLLRFGVLTLLSHPERRTIADLRRLFVDEAFREEILERVHNAGILSFWAHEYPKIPVTAAHPILNKLSAFLAPTSDLERIFSEPQNDLDFSAILDGGKILIVNLAKGVVGDEPSRLLGGLIVAGIQQAALARASRPEAERRDFYLFVDEFQNYVVSSFETILSESAKYRLNLTLANQNLGQLPKSLERAIFGNCSTLVAFQISAEDAPHLQREMHYADTVVRPKRTSDFYPLREFVASQRALYEAARQDFYLGMPYDERRELRSLRRLAPSTDGLIAGMKDEYIRGGMADAVLAERRAHLEHVLRVLADEENLDVAALRELFRDYEFRQRAFPEPSDFVNLLPRHAILRIGRAEDVGTIRTFPPSAPDASRRQSILERLRDRARERIDAKKAEPVQYEDSQPVPMAAEPPQTYGKRNRRRRPPALSGES